MGNVSFDILIVFEMLKPYIDEITTVMALPENFIIRFRYKKKWFNFDNPFEAIDKSCLISLRNTAIGQIMPIRFGKIIEIQDVGEIYYVKVSLNKFVEYNSGEVARKRQIVEFNKELFDAPLKGVRNPSEKGMERLIFKTPNYRNRFKNENYLGNTENIQIHSWGIIVSFLISLKEYETLDFIHIIDFKPKPTKNHTWSRESFFRVKGDRHYTITILQRRKLIEPIKEIHFLFDDVLLKSILNKQLAVGAYDILNFSFYSKEAENEEKMTSIVVKEVAKGDDETKTFPPIVLPICISRKSSIPYIFLVLIFSIASSVILFPQLIEHHLGFSKTFIEGELRNFCVFIAILTGGSIGTFGKSLISKLYKAFNK